MPVAPFLDVAPLGLNFQRSYQRPIADPTTLSAFSHSYVTRGDYYTLLLEVEALFTFSSVAKNRQVQLAITRGLGVFVSTYIAAGNYTASTTPYAIWGTYLTASSFTLTAAAVPLPPVLLPPGITVTVSIVNADASDVVDNSAWTVNEYLWDGSGDTELLVAQAPELSAAAPA